MTVTTIRFRSHEPSLCVILQAVVSSSGCDSLRHPANSFPLTKTLPNRSCNCISRGQWFTAYLLQPTVGNWLFIHAQKRQIKGAKLKPTNVWHICFSQLSEYLLIRFHLMIHQLINSLLQLWPPRALLLFPPLFWKAPAFHVSDFFLCVFNPLGQFVFSVYVAYVFKYVIYLRNYGQIWSINN